MPQETVLVTLDGSEFSRGILPHVQRFLSPGAVRLILLRVAPPPEQIGTRTAPGYSMEGTAHLPEETAPGAPTDEGYAAQMRQEYEQSLADELQLDASLLQDEGYDVEVRVRFGEPARQIADAVRDEGVALVAMATHGRSEQSQLVLGSVAAEVLRGVAVPMMLVRPAELYEPE